MKVCVLKIDIEKDHRLSQMRSVITEAMYLSLSTNKLYMKLTETKRQYFFISTRKSLFKPAVTPGSKAGVNFNVYVRHSRKKGSQFIPDHPNKENHCEKRWD